MKFDISKIPFSRYGSYMALAEPPDFWQGHNIRRGLYLKTVSGSADSPLAARIDLSNIDLLSDLDGGSLSLSSDNAIYDFCYPNPQTLLIRGSEGSSATLDFMTENGPYDYIYKRIIDGKSYFVANCYKKQHELCIMDARGENLA